MGSFVSTLYTASISVIKRKEIETAEKEEELGLSSFVITIISVFSSIFGCGCCVCCCYFLCKENEDETNVDHSVTNVNIPLRNVSSSTLTQPIQASGNVSNGNSDLAVTESTPMFNPEFSGKTTRKSIKHLIVNIDWTRLNFKTFIVLLRILFRSIPKLNIFLFKVILAELLWRLL